MAITNKFSQSNPAFTFSTYILDTNTPTKKVSKARFCLLFNKQIFETMLAIFHYIRCRLNFVHIKIIVATYTVTLHNPSPACYQYNNIQCYQ